MVTIEGEGWTLQYIIENGVLVGTKFKGVSRGMKDAMKMLNSAVEEAKKGVVV